MAIFNTKWQMIRTKEEDILILDTPLEKHGDPKAYKYAEVPSHHYVDWQDAPTNEEGKLHFVRNSRLTNTQENLNQIDFTYFRTFVDIPKDKTINEFKIIINKVDDGARMLIYNNDYPSGKYLPNKDGHLYGKDITVDFKDYATSGLNCICIIQFDDCPGGNKLTGGVKIVINGEEVTTDTILEIPTPDFGEIVSHLDDGSVLFIYPKPWPDSISWGSAHTAAMEEVGDWRLPTSKELKHIYSDFVFLGHKHKGKDHYEDFIKEITARTENKGIYWWTSDESGGDQSGNAQNAVSVSLSTGGGKDHVNRKENKCNVLFVRKVDFKGVKRRGSVSESAE